jgi:membrane peptidoglycan carboxypeptidase
MSWIAMAGLVSGCSPSAPCGVDHGCHVVTDLRQGVVLSGVYQILDRDGEPLASVGGDARRWVHLEALPSAVPAAWIAVEDRRFRDHGGVDLRGLVRAALTNLAEGGVAEGASTIPMQLVRALWPEQVWSLGRWKRKALELRMAPHLVSELGRDRVLELYLNAIYLGDGQYGVGAAARYYFGVSPEDLTLAQTATLVGMTKTPEAFNPREHPERSRARRDLVLGILAREGVAGREDIDAALASDLELAVDDPASRERSYVTAAVLRELRRVAPELVDQGGLILHTTIDPRAQEEALTAMREHLVRVEGGEHGLFLGGDQPVEGAAIALETSTGAILAVVGGRDFASTPLNRALQSRRPVGSLVKPLIFAAALERGVRATRPLATAALAIETEDGVWRPRDHVVVPYVLPHDMVVHSSNRAAIRLGQEAGAHTFAALARELGISGHIPMYPSTFLGAFDASLVEMTAAFAAFENGGRAVEPHFIRRIVNTEGITVWSRRRAAPARRVLPGSTADLVLDAMRGVVDEGTGAGVRRHLQGPAAGKTGTSSAGADAWFVGVRPGMAAGVWIGLDQPAPMVEEGGGAMLAVPLWGRWMAALDRLGYGQGDWMPSERLLRVSLGQRAEGDSVGYCRGGEGPSRLVPEWVLREMRVCEPTPLEWIQVDTGSEDTRTWEPTPVEMGRDTSRPGGPPR